MEKNVKELMERLICLNPEVKFSEFGGNIVASEWPSQLKYPEGYECTGKYEVTGPDGTVIPVYQW